MTRLAIPLILLCSPALAEPQCMDRATLIAQLDTQYNERQTVIAMEGRGMMLEVYVSPEGSFTVVAVSPDMRACVVAFGTDWKMTAPGVAG